MHELPLTRTHRGQDMPSSSISGGGLCATGHDVWPKVGNADGDVVSALRMDRVWHLRVRLNHPYIEN
jgi:hypothetical protein